MKSLTVRLPDELVAQLESEARKRKMSKSDLVRERLTQAPEVQDAPPLSEAIVDLVGSVDGLPSDLSAETQTYLKASGYGRHRSG